MTASNGLSQCRQRLASMAVLLFPSQRCHGTKVPPGYWVFLKGRIKMQAAIDRVMQTYGMIVNLSLDQEKAAREKVSSHLAERPNASEQQLAVEGLRYLRSIKNLESDI
jgi:hypothetical protein